MMIVGLVIIGVIIWALMSSSSRERVKSAFGGKERKDPLNIVRERYARGEITKEQFEQMKRDLFQR